MTAPLQNLIGQRFGRLVVVQEGEAYVRSYPNGLTHRARRMHCRCDCGNAVFVFLGHLRKGATKSCGCLRREVTQKRATIHGASLNGRTPEYRAWKAMKARCGDPKNRDFANYGARGIHVCSQWLHGDGGRTGFEVFLADMGPRPSPDHTIDRRDNDGPYAPGNCRWATREQQHANRRVTRLIEIDGEHVPLSKVAKAAGIKRSTLASRLDSGWPLERALGAVSKGAAR